MTQIRFFDGKKSVNLLASDVGWNGLDTNEPDVQKLWSVVSWFYRCVTVIANGVSSMPFDVLTTAGEVVYSFDGTTTKDNPPDTLPWLPNFPEMMSKTVASNLLVGEAYFEIRNGRQSGQPVQYDWMLPTTIEENISRTTGQVFSFKRTVGTTTIMLPPEKMLWFWMPDIGVEVGPAINTPGRSVMANSAIVGSMDAFLVGYFDRGMVKGTLLTYKDQISPEERERVKEWWKRSVTGLKGAFAALVVRGDFEPKTIGDGISDLGDHTAIDKQREAIATGLGVPQSKVSSNAANFATAKLDAVSFIEETIIPETTWIYAVANERMFEPQGYQIVARPNLLRVMQEDEKQRSAAFADYVGAGLSIEATVAILGIDVPEGVELVAAEPEPQPDPLTAAIPDTTTTSTQDIESITRSVDLMVWREERDQLLRWLQHRKATAVNIDDFETNHMSLADKTEVMLEWQNNEEINRHLFEYVDMMENTDTDVLNDD